MTYYLKQTKKKQHLGCVWFRREIVKRERGEKEYKKREKWKKYSRFDVLFGIREI